MASEVGHGGSTIPASSGRSGGGQNITMAEHVRHPGEEGVGGP